jgi:hypothetical protein
MWITRRIRRRESRQYRPWLEFLEDRVLPAAPVANADFAAVLPGQSTLIDVLANDTGQQPLTINSFVQRTHSGTVTLEGNALRYTADASAALGTHDTFTYTIADAAGHSASAQVHVDIGFSSGIYTEDFADANNPQLPALDSSGMFQHAFGPYGYDLLTNGTKPYLFLFDTDRITFPNLVAGVHVAFAEVHVLGGFAAVTFIGAHGAVRQTVPRGPQLVSVGEEHLVGSLELGSIHEIDLAGFESAYDRISIMVIPDRTIPPPFAGDDTASATPGVPVTIDVLANDAAADGGPLHLLSAGPAAHGTVQVVGGEVQYTAVAGYFGSDQFSYTIEDQHGLQASANVTIHVLPTAADITFVVPHGQTDSYTASAPGVLAATDDPAPQAIRVVAQPTFGTVAMQPDGTFTYTRSGGGLIVADSFTYVISDAGFDSNVATATLLPANQAPQANDATLHLQHRMATEPVFGHVSFGDPEGDPCTVSLVPGSDHGAQVSLGADGSFLYVPEVTLFDFPDWTATLLFDRSGPPDASFAYDAADNLFIQDEPGQPAIIYDPSVRQYYQATRPGEAPVARGTFQFQVTDVYGAVSNIATQTVEIEDTPPVLPLAFSIPVSGVWGDQVQPFPVLSSYSKRQGLLGGVGYLDAGDYPNDIVRPITPDDLGVNLHVRLLTQPIRAVQFAVHDDGSLEYEPLPGYLNGMDHWQFRADDGLAASVVCDAYIKVGNGGTGNDHIAQVNDAVDGQAVGLDSPFGTHLNDVQAIANPSPDGSLPPGIVPAAFPFGFFHFTVTETSGSTTVTVHLPESTTEQITYWKYGTTPDNPATHWYSFDYNPLTGVGAETHYQNPAIPPDEIVLHFVDNALGDDNPDPGVISDPGGLAFTSGPTAVLEPDPLAAGKTRLVVTGTPGKDSISLGATDAQGGIDVTVNGQMLGHFQPTGHIIVNSLDGDDTIRLKSTTGRTGVRRIGVPAFVIAGNGTDLVDASGSSANNVLVAGAGTSRLIAGLGRDILIASPRSAFQTRGDDLVIKGITPFDDDVGAQGALMAEWASPASKDATRIDHLLHGGGLNGADVLSGAVIAKSAHNTLLATPLELARPTLIGPKATLPVTAVAPTFSWNPVLGADHYQVHIDDLTSRQRDFLVNFDVVGTTWTPTAPLIQGHTYLWHMQGYDSLGNASLPSGALVFRIAPLAKPTLTGPKGPKAGATPTFAWGAVLGADHYQIILENVTTSRPVLVVTDANVSTTSWTPPFGLTAGVKYRWRVRAFGPGGSLSPWSDPVAFSV